MKKIVIVFMVLVCLCVPMFGQENHSTVAFDYVYTGGETGYSLIGGHYAVKGDTSGGLYAKVGFAVSVSDLEDSFFKGMEEFELITVNSVDLNYITIPMRIGSFFDFDINNGTTFTFLPSLRFNIILSSGEIETQSYGYNLDFDISSFGYDMGLSLEAAMSHTITNNIKLNYGIDFSFPFLTMILLDGEYSGIISGSVSDSSFVTIADSFAFDINPYIGIGFSF